MKERERFLARRNFGDPAFVLEILRLVQRYIGELFAEGVSPTMIHSTQRVHDAVCAKLSMVQQTTNILDLPKDARFPERGILTVSEDVSALIPLDSLENKGRFLIHTLDNLMNHLARKQRGQDAKLVAMLAIQLRRTIRSEQCLSA